MSIPVNQLGWMAGILDMKGIIVRKKNQSRRTPQLVLVVESKHREVIKRLGEMTGTSTELQKPQDVKQWMRKGCTDHCPEAHFHVHDMIGKDQESLYLPPIARWTITGAGMAVVLHNVLPFCVSAKNFTEVMAEALENTPLTNQGSGAVLKSLRRLDEIGWDLPPEYEKIKDRIWS